MATKIRGLQIVDSIAGAALDLTSSGILNVLVDGITVSTDGNQLSVIASGVDHNSLLNTHNLTTDIDHGSISGLDGDDHTQYILVDGTRDFTGIFGAVGMELTEGDVKLYSAPAAGDVSGITASGTTAATFGQVVYVDGSGNYVAAKADASATMPAAALVTAVSNEVMTAGYVTVSGWGWTPGGLLYVSDATAGDMTQTAPTASGSQVQIVGVAISATTIYFNPDATTVELGDSPFYTKEEVDTLISGSTASGVIDHGNLAGLADDDHTQYLLADGSRALSGDLLPNASGTVDLGSAALPYAEIHVDDIYVKGASIHLGGYEISEFSNDDTLADDSTTALPTEYAVKNYVATVSGGLENNIIWEVVDTPTNRIQPKAAHMGLPVFIADDLTVGGNLTVTGTIFYTQTEQVLISDNFMYLNYGETASGVSAVTAGIDIDRGGFPSYVFAFDERNDTFRIGVSGTQSSFNDYPLQPVATREDSPTDTRVPWWDAANYTFRTQGDSYVTINSGTDTIVLGTNDTTRVTVNNDGLALATGASVNEISTTITSSATDDQLATAQAIYEYVDSISGAMVHNELEGLQGGNGSDEYYHLDLTAFTALSGVDGTQVGQWDTAYSHTLSTSNPHSVTYSQVGAIQNSNDTVYDSHINWGNGANQVDLDDVPDGSSYERVAASQLNSGIYIDATDSVKGIASFSADNFLVTSGVVTVKDEGINEAELLIANAPIDGRYLQYTTASGMQWTDVSTEGVLESDFQLDNMSAECDDSETTFYLSYIPVANSLQVYLNGLLQEKGGGKDYTNTTSGVLFTTAPLTGDILIAHYVRTSA